MRDCGDAPRIPSPVPPPWTVRGSPSRLAESSPSNTGAESVLVIRDSHVTNNFAQGGDGGEGAADGEGIGGGVYNLGLFDLDDTLIFGNLASTSDDDVFSL